MARNFYGTPSFKDAPDPGSVNSCQSLDAAGAAASPNPAGGSHLLNNQAEHWLCSQRPWQRTNRKTTMQPSAHSLCCVCRRIEVVLFACDNSCNVVSPQFITAFASQTHSTCGLTNAPVPASSSSCQSDILGTPPPAGRVMHTCCEDRSIDHQFVHS